MSLLRVFDLAGQGMSAQSIRMNTTASNMANAQTAAPNETEAYKAKKPVFEAVQKAIYQQSIGNSGSSVVGVGVRVLEIAESNAPLDMRYEPAHPQSNEDGYVFYSNVNVVEEMTDMIAASRAFQINVDVMDSAKTMATRLLSLGK